ncbi:hypothetical protein EMPS_05798 [Entomortierella parvispora]|uniref:RRM domain-containing protein n=1 Tax=Entomortierella parvispora TaxID=205924 RepID=A0A9P3HB24_9FUNG|nr:hypothetical protein EMPS_05798 [Entomortierella parvispora]
MDMADSTRNNTHTCQICQAKDEVIKAKDAVIAAKDDAIAQKDQALKGERELREQLQKQLKMATTGVTKKASLVNIKSASSQAQEEKDALTIYIRNVTESITSEMLHDAFSTFGAIRTLNVVHPKACAFVEFASPEAHQKALAATSVFVGEGHENVLTEKRVRKPPQAFTRRPSNNNMLKSYSSHNNLNSSFGIHSVSAATAAISLNTNASTLGAATTTTTAAVTTTPPPTPPSQENDKVQREGWLKKGDDGRDLSATC